MAIILKEETSLNSMVKELEEKKKRLLEDGKEIEEEKKEINKEILSLKKKYEKEGKAAFNKRFGWIYPVLAVVCSIIFATICLLNKSFKDLSTLIPWALSLMCVIFIYIRARRSDIKRFLQKTTGKDIDAVIARRELLNKTSETVAHEAADFANEMSRKGAEIAGNKGEQSVINYIKENFKDDTYLINDIRIQNDGKSTQIDHVLVCPRGVFCIETKNYASAYTILNEEKWSFRKGREKIIINSPISQSVYHTQMLYEALFGAAWRVVPLVIFANNRGSFRGHDDRCKIIRTGELLKTVKRYKKVYSDKETKEIAYKILELNIR